MKRRFLIWFGLPFLLLVTAFILYRIYWLEIQMWWQSSTVIYWSEDVEISYDDYLAIPDYHSEGDIFYFHAFYIYYNDRDSIHVWSHFDRTKSWVKDTSNFDFEEVNRRQKVRFDLFEVYARKFNQEIEKLQGSHDVKVEATLKIGDSLFAEIKEYDRYMWNTIETQDEYIDKWRPVVDSLLQVYPRFIVE